MVDSVYETRFRLLIVIIIDSMIWWN